MVIRTMFQATFNGIYYLLFSLKNLFSNIRSSTSINSIITTTSKVAKDEGMATTAGSHFEFRRAEVAKQIHQNATNKLLSFARVGGVV